MANVFLATLGQRPEAITVALDVLHQRYDYAEAVVLHTDPVQSGVAVSWAMLRDEMARSYPDLLCSGHELVGVQGEPIIDIDSRPAAEAYYAALLQVLGEFIRHEFTVHLLVSGGRKSMSIYATLAAAALFGPDDRLWTVLSPPEMLQEPRPFHAPPEHAHRVTVMHMPVFNKPTITATNRETYFANPMTYKRGRMTQRAQFLQALTDAEREVAETLALHPRATNGELARLTGKAQRTIENQLRRTYVKMTDHIPELAPETNHRRQSLIDVMLDRI